MTRRSVTTAAAVVVAVPIGLLAGQPPATAADGFGHHVRACAQGAGFGGDHHLGTPHSPGAHRGASGWDHDTHHC